MSIPIQYLTSAIQQFRLYRTSGLRALEQLNEDDFGKVLAPESNSITVIVQHLSGNMRSRWTDFLTTDGEKPDRNRDAEFVERLVSREEVLRLWDQGWECCFRAVEALTPDDLSRTVTIRQQPHTVVEAINRQLTHSAYHVGQIVFIAKALRGSAWHTLSIPRGQSEEYNRTLS